MKDAELIARYDGRVPRYTSYPTAPHFHAGIGPDLYMQWLHELPPQMELSLYLHVPFCERLCLYCGCHTTVARGERPRRRYAEALAREIEQIAGLLGRRARVSRVHWGGGTPTALPGDCLVGLMDLIRSRFLLDAQAEIAIEIDPARLPEDRLDALARMGVTRASLGVQDFDSAVQKAIGRPQSFAQTREAAQALRSLGVGSINLDLIYGLPEQTEASVARTARAALALQADRAAVFGYAHVPWMKKHQALIREASLPGAEARLTQEAVIRHVLETEGGFLPVGLDHYALPEDELSLALRAGRLSRSFQGYTTDSAPCLIGLGASAIGQLPQGYVQNNASIPGYEESLGMELPAVVRGVALTHDDRLRRAVIERIMCDLEADLPAIAACFGTNAAQLLEDAAPLAGFAADGLVEWKAGHLRVTPRGRPFVRNVAALFDRYLTRGASLPRHARAL